MMDYAAEIERIAAENRRRMSLLLDELDEAKRQTEINARACAEWFAAQASRERREREEAGEHEAGEREAWEPHEAEPRERSAATAHRLEEPALHQAQTRTPRGWPQGEPTAEQERREAQLHEQRAAIARAAAYRKANEMVRPTDDEDEDDEYYRRKSWLE